ncbi:hypothetical protein [Parachitinimonas caeni]|uniref:Uncharacterized protein n=1 Tax=Parachitinimonas caeni TaxID=3031301 RepID=A0ABT7E1S0_9NEIS|nr:hypothetical protein [Parachitinimonas caeni]MDK2126259.1 hypothetical protein [Parachitinimonas caeni]
MSALLTQGTCYAQILHRSIRQRLRPLLLTLIWLGVLGNTGIALLNDLAYLFCEVVTLPLNGSVWMNALVRYSCVLALSVGAVVLAVGLISLAIESVRFEMRGCHA